MPRDGSDEVADLWAMAAELERLFAAYKQRLAERNGGSANTAADDDAAAAAASDHDDDDASGGGGGEEVEPGGGGDSGGDVIRGRMYEAYVRRRDERLRQGWRARMERKEAEVKALWAQLELSGRRAGGNSGGGRSSTSGGAGDGEEKTERNEDDQDTKRSSDAALAPRRVSGKKHARTRSFSSSTNTSTDPVPDVGRQRALSQEPPPSEPQAVAGDNTSKESRGRRAGGAAKTATTATSRPKTSLRRKNPTKGHGSAKQTGPKLPRSLPRRASSGGLEDLSKEVVLPTAGDAAVPLRRRSDEQDDVHGEEAPEEASPPRPSTSIGAGAGAGAGNAQTASPAGSDRSELVDVVPEGKPEAKNADVKKQRDEVDDASPDKVGSPNGEITSDSDIEPNYVYINKDDIVKEEHAMSLPETRAASVAVPPDFNVKINQDNSETTTTTSPAGATAIATTNAEEAPARESSGDSSSPGRLGRSPPSSAKTSSCSSRDQSIERVLEADAALLRKKREKKQRAEKSVTKTPGSAGSRVSGTARSPKETPKGFKRFLSFGKKNRARGVTVIDCASPSVSSVADDDDSGRWQSAGSIKPRMGSSDAGSDATHHARTTSPPACSLQSLIAASPAKSELTEIVSQVKSPKAQRSFFSFRSLNCGRG